MQLSDLSVSESGTTPLRPELLVSAALHLMSQYASQVGDARTCPKLASVIEKHLKALADMPGLTPVLSATCQQLSEQWAALVDQALQAQQRPSLLQRFTSKKSAR